MAEEETESRKVQMSASLAGESRTGIRAEEEEENDGEE